MLNRLNDTEDGMNHLKQLRDQIHKITSKYTYKPSADDRERMVQEVVRWIDSNIPDEYKFMCHDTDGDYPGILIYDVKKTCLITFKGGQLQFYTGIKPKSNSDNVDTITFDFTNGNITRGENSG